MSITAAKPVTTPIPVQPDATEQDLIPPTRTTYSGRVEIGEDLMVIAVGEQVEVRRPARSSP